MQKLTVVRLTGFWTSIKGLLTCNNHESYEFRRLSERSVHKSFTKLSVFVPCVRARLQFANYMEYDATVCPVCMLFKCVQISRMRHINAEPLQLLP